MWRPTDAQARGDREASGGAAPRRVRRRRLPRPLPLNLAAPDDAIYEKSIATMRTHDGRATAIGADAVIFHVGSHLGAGFEAGLERTVAALEQSSSAATATRGSLENSAGTGGDDRPLGRGARDADRARSTGTRGSGSASTRATYTPRATTSPTRVVDDARDAVDESIGLDRLRALHVNDSADPARLEPRPAREHPRGRARRGPRRLPRPSGVPAPERLPRGAGRQPRGRRAPRSSQKVRDLHARWTRLSLTPVRPSQTRV